MNVMASPLPESRRLAGAPERRLAAAFILAALAALLLGFLLGPPQAFNYAGVNVYDHLPLKSYYQGLTWHGVLMGLVFTSFYICGLLLYLPAAELGMRPRMAWGWTAWWLMVVGTAMAGIAMLANTSNVLYTLYPPLMAHWAFYLGLALVVVGTLICAALVVEMRLTWLRHNPGRPTPLVTYMSTVTWLMWALASLGLVVAVVGMLLPWSLGWIDGVDPQLFRSLFWYTGHPIVYFWLLPAYVGWYAIVPRLAGGKLLSDPMARLVFLLFLLFSIPVGFHHQYADPGVPVSWKLVHNMLTMFVGVPSLITAFTVAASLEIAGRERGGRGLVGWIGALPWREPAFAAQVLAMVTFIFGGAGGIILASFALNLMVHNTVFVPGHFHITVGTAVALSFMGLSFLLLPRLLGRRPVAQAAASASAWLWFAGMMLFAAGMHWLGVLGVPRRAQVSALAGSAIPEFHAAVLPRLLTGAGGALLLAGGLCFFWWLLRSLLAPRAEADGPLPFAEALSGPADANGMPKPGVRVMDRLLLWSVVAAVLILAAYGAPLAEQFRNMVPVSGMRLW